jgi:tetratricopeptide (TPR) repeat protein
MNKRQLIIRSYFIFISFSKRIQEWRKAIAICEQALLLRPRCLKALTRAGLAYVQVGELDKAEVVLKEALDIALTSAELKSTNTTENSEQAAGKVQALLDDIARRRAASEVAAKKQRRAMATVFGRSSESAASTSCAPSCTVSANDGVIVPYFGVRVYYFYIVSVIVLVISILLVVLYSFSS